MQVKSKKTCLNTLSSAPAGLSQTDFLEEVKNDNASSQSGAVEMMNYLKENYKHINFSFISFDNNSQIGQYGSTMKGKNNVAISSELLEKMSTDEEVRNHVENILRHLNSYQNAAQTGAFLKDKELVSMGLVIDEDGKVSMWTATKDRDKEKIYPTYWRDEESTNFYSKYAKKKNSSSNYNFSRSNNMMRLASAKNVPAVRGLIAAKYGEIQTVKAKVKDPVEAAAIVRRIYQLAVEGHGLSDIANNLYRDKVESPAAYLARQGRGPWKSKENIDRPYAWSDFIVGRILSKPEYMGHTVNFRSHKESYKDKQPIFHAPEDWLIFEDTHEAIVDKGTWELVQKLRGTPRRIDTLGEANPLTGLVFCADCGAKMYNQRTRGSETKPYPSDAYECSSYKLAGQGRTAWRKRKVHGTRNYRRHDIGAFQSGVRQH